MSKGLKIQLKQTRARRGGAFPPLSLGVFSFSWKTHSLPALFGSAGCWDGFIPAALSISDKGFMWSLSEFQGSHRALGAAGSAASGKTQRTTITEVVPSAPWRGCRRKQGGEHRPKWAKRGFQHTTVFERAGNLRGK